MPMSASQEMPSEWETKYLDLQKEIKQLRRAHQTALEHLRQQQRLEEQHHLTQVRFRTIFEESRLASKILSRDLIIRQVNPALVTLLGYTHKEEIAGTRILDYTHPDYVNQWDELQTQLWEEQIPSFSLETCLLKRDGTAVLVNITSILFEDEGELLGYTILEDITLRKQAEQKAERLYEAQEIMLYTVAHDLKNPLLNMHALTQLIEKAINPGQANEELATYLRMMEQAYQTAQAILEDLLLVGELESDFLPKQSMEVGHWLESCLSQVQVSAAQKGIVFESSLPDAPVYALLNQVKMERLLANLLSNAIKFSASGGQITLGLEHQRQRIRLWVRDEGMGIPEPLQASVFDKFTKANRQGTLGESTTGLGLYIVKRIVELHQGRIWLESQEGKGTTFYVDIPIVSNPLGRPARLV